MRTHNLGYPRIGGHRELKKVCEQYWSGKTGHKNVLQVGRNIRRENWLMQKNAGIDLVPCNDFSFYDHVLDHSFLFGAIPPRYNSILLNNDKPEIDLYFAMARGYQKDGLDLPAMEMTKWFDTNYHYIVPEFTKDQQFSLFSTKVIDDFYEARELGIVTKTVLIGPVSYLLLGKEKEAGFSRLDLIGRLLPVYVELLTKLTALGADWVQFDEPFLCMDLSNEEQEAFAFTYRELRRSFPRLGIILATYFGSLEANTPLACSLPVNVLHVDLVRGPQQLEGLISELPADRILSLGLVDGRNIWRNDFTRTLATLQHARNTLGTQRIWVAPSCSLLHCPCDLDEEGENSPLPAALLSWLSFAKQKVSEVVTLARLSGEAGQNAAVLAQNAAIALERKQSPLIHKPEVGARVRAITAADARRQSPFPVRRIKQRARLKLPAYPTTTIGSFPQTPEVRRWRAQLKSGVLSAAAYESLIKAEIEKAIRWQEELGLDVLVHGEFERNDMVEYFGEQLEGIAFTANGWVQSYGSRCVKPPVIFGDVSRKMPMTVAWTAFAQSLTPKIVKGMLTGPVTILQWSFVRDDQPRSETCFQLALAIRDEVKDLEEAGIAVIQIDEPALREGLPLRHADWRSYLEWAVTAFRLAASPVADDTQIHTHMCYAEFNDIIESIADMDADVITIETSRSQMDLLDAFANFNYPNEIGPGVYDIHSPRVPAHQEMVDLLKKANAVIPEDQLWVNPDCGLKTRSWEETRNALHEMVEAARYMRS
ncbi:5-methyltetrahydropteroyltriglutamate--homocysteine S-methyltransferase [Pedobacter yulinensis]|uniref:5-methyltetrahydropteroyltriglutamate--homocysteine methyltransferase n=1 Tax=Pedobacter yulinensis TaxID=2126353 RepID=A0A2T3HRF5_9SPHI|nr:5-methyltetrahydropteroyltriglutamate--homocysteine S-methyltransferase [Pedobacter yulinensis]PST85050.1 5-methyltetrahydropteroyltriglutamate--homocysteine S-methyltransferase [Pedobacter yulinensis]